MRPAALAATAALMLSVSLARAGDTWTTPYPGLRYLERTTSYPRHIVAAQIDLCAAGVSVRATASSERTRSTSSFAKLVGAKLAVNADFFSWQNNYATSGLAIGNGSRWADTRDTGGHGFLAFGLERLHLSPPAEVVDPPPAWMRDVVGGNLQVLTAGVPIGSDSGDFCVTRHPRTVAGLSKDHRTLILAVIDGRTSTAVGMRCTEMGALMKELGAWDALNLDGGGSSTMYLGTRGVVNRPSDGSERVVGNHLGILIAGGGEPGSCDRSFEESAIFGDAHDSSTTTDVDGDGRADLCARGADGVSCALSTGASFATPLEGPRLSDANGWADASNYATLRMGDLNGDGKADLCVRANAGVLCYLSDGKGFPTQLAGPALSDEDGWSAPGYYGTFRLADLDGDGKDDLCARSSRDFRCYPSTGAGFGAAVTLDAMTDADYGEPEYYGTLRMGDVNGDGKADLCARSAAGITCWPSTGTGFGPALAGPGWSDASGWGALPYWSTIRLVDVDGDGRADLCARAAKGLVCHLSTGTGFGDEIAGPEWSDAKGWSRHQYYSTLRFADLDGDGDRDACARAAAGVTCARWNGSGFDAEASTGLLSNDNGWDALRFYSTIRFADVNDDGRADLCARASAGAYCWLADGAAGFAPQVTGPAWSDANGWGALSQFSTFRAAGPACRAVELCGNGLDDDCSGVADDGCGGAGGAAADGGSDWQDAGAAGTAGAAGRGGGGTTMPSAESSAGGSCGCRAAGRGRERGSAALTLALGLAAGAARRRRRV
ncbi:MAG: FG-GAP-like repeat-containing protein [Sorangiineae bacterium]|nr:FG-GAP-like repeat-containing protein [Polyangiaceae bacterium]MEB2324505.1 FG-GAP-like repeat-containing protein [Sorangiineae bacterium]